MSLSATRVHPITLARDSVRSIFTLPQRNGQTCVVAPMFSAPVPATSSTARPRFTDRVLLFSDAPSYPSRICECASAQDRQSTTNDQDSE
jgi:hypothetical protein